MYRKHSDDIPFGLIVVIFIIFFWLGFGWRACDKASNERQITTTITDKTVKNDKDESKYLIFCQDSEGVVEVFEVTDSILMGRFNSSDLYAKLKIGTTYEFTVCGTRRPFFSWYPNIYDAREVK